MTTIQPIRLDNQTFAERKEAVLKEWASGLPAVIRGLALFLNEYLGFFDGKATLLARVSVGLEYEEDERIVNLAKSNNIIPPERKSLVQDINDMLCSEIQGVLASSKNQEKLKATLERATAAIDFVSKNFKTTKTADILKEVKKEITDSFKVRIPSEETIAEIIERKISNLGIEPQMQEKWPNKFAGLGANGHHKTWLGCIEARMHAVEEARREVEEISSNLRT